MNRPPLDPDPLFVDGDELWDPTAGEWVPRPSFLPALFAGVIYGLALGLLAGVFIANHVLAASPAVVEPIPVVRPQPGAPTPVFPNRQRPAPIGAAPIGDAASAAPGPDTAASLSGTASWYPASGLIAAAGPALRDGDWRGSTVTVSAGGRSVTVTLSDFCQCYGSRLIDLSDDAFRRLAPLSRGLLRVSVADVDAATIPPTDEELP